MFVVEYGYDAAMLLERRGNFAEEAPAWKEVLPLVIPRVIAVLANAEHPVDRNSRGADGNRAFDYVSAPSFSSNCR